MYKKRERENVYYILFIEIMGKKIIQMYTVSDAQAAFRFLSSFFYILLLFSHRSQMLAVGLGGFFLWDA